MCLEVKTTATGLMMHPYMFEMANPPAYKEVTTIAKMSYSPRNCVSSLPHGITICASRPFSKLHGGSARMR